MKNYMLMVAQRQNFFMMYWGIVKVMALNYIKPFATPLMVKLRMLLKIHLLELNTILTQK
jgi:hypothetical protein